MKYEATKDVKIANISCGEKDRYLPPTKAAIRAMMSSLKSVGQIAPIAVYPITTNQYRIIAGATRFRAASELDWEKIRVSVFSGSAVDFEIYEIAENLERRELSPEQRREMKTQIKRLQAERLASIKDAKGGRGHKGGLREAAREEGIPRTTARRRKAEEDKVGQHTENGPVSKPAPAAKPNASARFGVHVYSIRYTEGEFQRVRKWCADRHLNLSDGTRQIIHERLDADERAQRSGIPTLHVV